MSTDTSKYTTGVYLLTNTITNTVYVGSTAESFHRRWKSHEHHLRRGTHGNCHLQRAWDRDGADAFVFSIKEVVMDRAMILPREQYWIDQYLALPSGSCYNMSPTAQSVAGRAVSEEMRRRISETLRGDYHYNLLSPEGIEYRDIDNIAAFCREHRLSSRHVFSVAAGKRLSHKGWTAIGADRSRIKTKVFSFTSPEGIEYRGIHNLTAFCKEHQLDTSTMSAVDSGKASHHLGWRKVDSAFRPKYAFISPDGIVYRDIVKLAPFCRIHKLNKDSMCILHNGHWKQYKGWRKAD